MFPEHRSRNKTQEPLSMVSKTNRQMKIPNQRGFDAPRQEEGASQNEEGEPPLGKDEILSQKGHIYR